MDPKDCFIKPFKCIVFYQIVVHVFILFYFLRIIVFHFIRPMRLHTKSEGRCEMHPKSVNMNIMEPESQWVIYHMIMKTSGVSEISPKLVKLAYTYRILMAC